MGKPKYRVESGGSAVIAVKFAHGSLKEDVDRKKMSWQIYKKKQVSREKQSAMLAIAELGGMTYRGSQEVDDTCDYYMGVQEPGSKTVLIHPAAFITMHPVIADPDETLVTCSSKEPVEKDFRAKRDDLIMEFGSGKMMKSVQRRKKDKLNEEMLSTTTQAGADTAMVESPVVSGRGQQDQDLSVLSAMPPCNTEAKRPEDVYKLTDIIPPDVSQALKVMCQPMYKSTTEEIEAWAREKRYPSFIITQLITLSIQDNVRLLQCQCLTYLDYLMFLFKLKSQQIRLKHPLPSDWHQEVKTYMLKSFTQERREKTKYIRTFPAVLKDKLLNHILVLCLKLSKHFLELNPLMADLGIASKKLVLHCQYLGCTKKEAANPGNPAVKKIIAELKVPVKFPENKQKYGGR